MLNYAFSSKSELASKNPSVAYQELSSGSNTSSTHARPIKYIEYKTEAKIAYEEAKV